MKTKAMKLVKATILVCFILAICGNHTFRQPVEGAEKQPLQPEKGKKMSDKEIAEIVLTRLGEPGGKVLVSRDDVKSVFPDRAKWLEHKQGKDQYVFCVIDLRILGVYKEEVRGWVYREYSKQWSPIFTTRLQDTAGVNVSVDPKTGIFTT